MESATLSKKPAKPTRRVVAVTVKGDSEWKRWLEEAASHCRMGVSALVDVSVMHYARSQGFAKKPPER